MLGATGSRASQSRLLSRAIVALQKGHALLRSPVIDTMHLQHMRAELSGREQHGGLKSSRESWLQMAHSSRGGPSSPGAKVPPVGGRECTSSRMPFEIRAEQQPACDTKPGKRRYCAGVLVCVANMRRGSLVSPGGSHLDWLRPAYWPRSATPGLCTTRVAYSSGGNPSLALL